MADKAMRSKMRLASSVKSAVPEGNAPPEPTVINTESSRCSISTNPWSIFSFSATVNSCVVVDAFCSFSFAYRDDPPSPSPF